MNYIKQLNESLTEQYIKDHPTIPLYAIPKVKHDDSTSNGLQKAIMAYFSLNGLYCARINSTGTYSQKLGRFIKSGATRGVSDLSAIVDGKHLSIEVKIAKDKLRPDQIKIKDKIIQSGGLFIVVKSFDDFIKQYEEIIGKKAFNVNTSDSPGNLVGLDRFEL